MELTTGAMALEAFYRLVGSESGDQELTRQGEDTDEVGYIFLTRGARAAQRWMIAKGTTKGRAATVWSSSPGVVVLVCCRVPQRLA